MIWHVYLKNIPQHEYFLVISPHNNMWRANYDACFADIVQLPHKKAQRAQRALRQEHTSGGRVTLDQPGWNHQTEFSDLFVKYSSCYK